VGCLNLYQTHSQTLSMPGAGVYVKAFGGDVRRLVLILSISLGDVVLVANQDGPAFTGSFVTFTSNVISVLPYRDYGPLIQREIWIATIAAASTVDVTEILAL